MAVSGQLTLDIMIDNQHVDIHLFSRIEYTIPRPLTLRLILAMLENEIPPDVSAYHLHIYPQTTDLPEQRGIRIQARYGVTLTGHMSMRKLPGG